MVGPMRTKDQTLEQMALIRSQRTARLKAALRTQYGVKETPNALLELPLDLHRYMYILLCQTYSVWHSQEYTSGNTAILLGPYKYLLRTLMGHLTNAQKDDLQARLLTFDFSGLDYKMSYNLIRHYRSFVGTRVCTCLHIQHITSDLFLGRDFKALAQVSLFLLGPYMSPQ